MYCKFHSTIEASGKCPVCLIFDLLLDRSDIKKTYQKIKEIKAALGVLD